MSHKISVILPVYNGEDYLKDSIESILNQTYLNFELIIIDDCSSDKSGEIAQQYVNLDKRVFYFRNIVNLKLPESLNIGFSKATGTYYTWTSCDNLYMPNAFIELLSVIDSNKDFGLVYASMQTIDKNNNIIGIIEAGVPDDLIFRNVVGACFLYSKSIVDKVGGYNKDMFLCEDYEYWIRIASSFSIIPIRKCLYKYRIHSKSLSHNNNKEIIKKGIQVQKQYYSLFIKNRKQAAIFYCYLRARDIYNQFRQLYLLHIFFYSPSICLKEIYKIFIAKLKVI